MAAAAAQQQRRCAGGGASRVGAVPSARGTARRAARSSSGSTCTNAARTTAPPPPRQQQQPPAWQRVVPRLALCGAVLGTLLDGIHSRVALQVYDLGAVQLPTPLGPLETSLLVPPLLATWYAVMGGLVLAADALPAFAGSPATAAAAARAASAAALPLPAAATAAGYALLAANLQLSAALYSNGADYQIILAALAATWAASWALLDRTPQGALLSIICAIGAPAAELVLMSVFHTWHYSRPDALGGAFVSWVPCCYGGYVPLLAALTRQLAAQARRQGPASGEVQRPQ